MRRTLGIGALAGLVASVAAGGTAGATPDGSQLLRGLGDRSFAVEVTVTESVDGGFGYEEGTVFENCYSFGADGTFVDPLFPSAGSWEQHSNGAKTSYTAFASVDVGFTVDFEQHGTVRPVPSSTLRLEADTHVTSSIGVSASFHSVGMAVDACD